ncbi:MAG: M24 family metallopeptidase [Planctomycetes bacterium]|nr:M24 family metallopeptidase [Planctomycetota bacterium]
MSSAEIPVAGAERAVEVERKHQAVTGLLATRQLDALLIQRPSNFAWFTAGGDCTRGCGDATAALFITPHARVLVCGNADTGRLFERELPGLGFQLKERPWYEPRHVLIEDLCRGRRVASDTGVRGTTDVSSQLAALRLPLSDRECNRLRELGRILVHALEATARNLQLGQTEAEIAGELAHRLIRRSARPERIQVWGDGIGRRYRHWSYAETSIDQWCVLSAIARRDGICVGAARTVCFGEPPQEILGFYQRALLVHATGMFFSKVGWELGETWARVERIYEKFDVAEEWRLADQADVIGYEISEAAVVPDSRFRLAAEMPVYWHPTVGPCLVADTILVGSPRTKSHKGFEILTPPGRWPTVKVEVKGVPIVCPAILTR